MVFLIIYILGVITNFLLISFLEFNDKGELTIQDLAFFMFMSFFSWISLIVGLLILYGDRIVVFKKK